MNKVRRLSGEQTIEHLPKLEEQSVFIHASADGGGPRVSHTGNSGFRVAILKSYPEDLKKPKRRMYFSENFSTLHGC